MKFLYPILILTALLCLHPEHTSVAQEAQPADAEAVMERAVRLKNLLDQLLSDSNHSSIHKALSDSSGTGDPMVEEALRLKASGEQMLADQDYLHAAMTLQSALDKFFQVIRSKDDGSTAEQFANGRLAQAIAANDTFLAAATRVVDGDPNGQGADLLAQARQSRELADTRAEAGDSAAALENVEQSTRLAQEAIMSVRNGMVIERAQ
jgi:hypothetical protein